MGYGKKVYQVKVKNRYFTHINKIYFSKRSTCGKLGNLLIIKNNKGMQFTNSLHYITRGLKVHICIPYARFATNKRAALRKPFLTDTNTLSKTFFSRFSSRDFNNVIVTVNYTIRNFQDICITYYKYST